MSEIDVILPNMRGASVQVGSRVHALFLPGPSRPRRAAAPSREGKVDIRAEFAARATAPRDTDEAVRA